MYAVSVESYCINIGYPWDILSANAYFLKHIIKGSNQGTIEDGVVVKGDIVLGEGSVIKSGTYIEGNCFIGKNCIIGPNAFLRGPVVL